MEKSLQIKNKLFVGHVAGLASCLIWGLAFINLKVLLPYFNSGFINLVRYIIASLFVFCIHKVTGSKIRLCKKDKKKIILSGVFGMALYNVFTTLALNTVSASMVGVFNGAVPIITIIINSLFVIKGKLSKKVFFAGILSLIGIILVVLSDGSITDFKGSILGFFYLILSLLVWLFYVFISKSLIVNGNGITILMYQVFFSFIAMIPFSLIEIMNNGINLKYFLKVDVVISFVILGIFCSGLGFIFYSNALKNIGTNMSSMYMNLIPIVSVLASAFILGEKLTYLKLFGVVIIITSLFLCDVE
jgi:drug/metabolite transporter (DMT)-like permease